jgi:hypothetical protein
MNPLSVDINDQNFIFDVVLKAVQFFLKITYQETVFFKHVTLLLVFSRAQK